MGRLAPFVTFCCPSIASGRIAGPRGKKAEGNDSCAHEGKPGQAGRISPCSHECDQIFVVHVELCFSSRLQSSGPSDDREQGPLSAGQPSHGTCGPRGTRHWSRGSGVRWRYSSYSKYESVVVSRSGRRGRCADIQSLPGCPVGLTLNGPARPVPGPTRLEPQCYRAHAQAKKCRAERVRCRAVVLPFFLLTVTFHRVARRYR